MPSYHQLGITARLSSTPLEQTNYSHVTAPLSSVPLEQTTHRNSALGNGEVAKRQSEAARKKLLSSAYLPERRAPLLDGEDDHELNRLGGVPFMQVQADGSAPRWSQLKTQVTQQPGV